MFWITIVVIFDQLTKTLVENYLVRPVFAIPGFLWFSYTRNTGVAFGLFSKQPWVIWIVLGVTIALTTIPVFIRCSRLTKVGLQMVVGGALGNIIDRLRTGWVIDFINVKYFPAVFNVADLFITIGGALIIVSLLWREKRFEPDRYSARRRTQT